MELNNSGDVVEFNNHVVVLLSDVVEVVDVVDVLEVVVVVVDNVLLKSVAVVVLLLSVELTS